MDKMRCSIGAIAVLFVVQCQAQEPTITQFEHSGLLQWTSSETSGYFTVEWAPTPTGVWQRSWAGLKYMPASSGGNEASVPMFYRVVWQEEVPAVGAIIEINSEILGTTTEGSTVYAGTLDNIPVVVGTLSISFAGYSLSDNGDGTLSGNSDTFGSINYETGAWFIDLGANYADGGLQILGSYSQQTPSGGLIEVRDKILGYGVAGKNTYSGYMGNHPLAPGSITITAPGYIFQESGTGWLSGTAGTIGTINYITGWWTLDLGEYEISAGGAIVATYSIVTD